MKGKSIDWLLYCFNLDMSLVWN